jgi:glycine/D-amino acid oxidase-like deaminating enzyme/nitrite reductase/ring-hydroxylating ferredoxin subunit
MTPRDTTSYWADTQPLPEFGPVRRPARFDVVVIGGGLTGITAAYLLKASGKTVALVDRDRCAGPDTGNTSAHLTFVTDTPLATLADRFGDDKAQLAWDAGLAAIGQIEELVQRESIDCDFSRVPGYLHVPRVPADNENGHDAKSMDARIERELGLATELGFDVKFRSRIPLMERPGLEYPGQARFHPRRYLQALLRRIDGGGSAVFEMSQADEVLADPLRVVVNGHELSCDDVVVATHNPIVGRAGMIGHTLLQTELALYTTYVVAARVPSGAVPDALYWDLADPYHYLRLVNNAGFDVAIFGGEDHKTGQVQDTAQCFARLQRTLHAILPGADITHRWSGQVLETRDGLPFMGYMAPHQYAVTGFSGTGLTFGTLGAMMAHDAILGRTNPWQDLFDLRRKNIADGLWDYLRENKDYPYYLIRDRVAGDDVKSLDEVPRNEGRVLTIKGKRVAAFRSFDGNISVRSAICTHMGCVVHWNTAEKTWDCPCHGSRFAPSGRVLSGPAERALGPVEQAVKSPVEER